MGMWAQWRDIGLGFGAGLAVAALVAVVLIQAPEREAAAAYTTVASAPSAAANVADMEALAERFDVSIVWTGDERNCGGGGCFSSATPGVIYVKPGLDAVSTRHLVLHELGHVLHYRVGLGLDECAADRFAQSMGSTGGTYCPISGQ